MNKVCNQSLIFIVKRKKLSLLIFLQNNIASEAKSKNNINAYSKYTTEFVFDGSHSYLPTKNRRRRF